MSRESIEQLRLPVGLLLLAIVAFVLWPRSENGDDAAVATTPAPTVVAGSPGGEVITPQPTPSLTPVATRSEEPTPTQEPTPAEEPAPDDDFSAEVLACRSISGSRCNGELRNVPPNVSTFTALVRFTGANAGDVLEAILTGPAGTTSSGGYALQGGGEGYYYSVFQMGSLPAGDYVLTATRNGTEVAVTSFRTRGD